MICVDFVRSCSSCRELLPADPDAPAVAAFWAKKRDAHGRVLKWQAYCKPCSKASNRAHQQANADRVNATRRARHAERMKDPEYRARHQARQARWLAKPGSAETMARYARRYRARRRQEDPETVRELERIDYRLRRERQGFPARSRRTVIDGTQPRIPTGPFLEWLEAYYRLVGGEWRAMVLGLGLDERRVRYMRNGQKRVAQDTVDRALTHAQCVVRLHGRDIVTLDDLYP